MHRNLMALILMAAAIFGVAQVATAGRIYLRSGTIDTDGALAMAGREKGRISGSGYYMVTFTGPITDENRQSVIDAGARIIEYLPDFTYLVRVSPLSVNKLRSLSGVEWVGGFKAEHKISTQVADSKRQGQFVVKLFADANPDAVMGKGKMLGAKKIACEKRGQATTCRMLANKTQLQKIAQIESVEWIEPYVQAKLCNDVAAGISGVPEVRNSLGLYGSGQMIGLADSGLDTGNASALSVDFSGRVEKAYALRRTNDWSDLNGHGTHVAGSLIGSGAASGANPTFHSYDNSFAGYAPEARLVFQSIGDGGDFVFPPLHLSELFTPVYADGVRVHSDSWGSGVAGQYTVYSNEVDQFAWDHKDFLTVFAVGNEAVDLNIDGIVDPDSLYAPATAKNCIAVGATENNRSSGGYQVGYGVAWATDYPAAPIRYDLMSNNPGGMAAYSGRGPTDDGRIKPDLCAPGTNIVSCRAPLVELASSWNWGVYNSNYVYMGGTSMSAPQVAGAAALAREYYVKEKGINPSAALIKATLIAGALDISPGQYGTGTRQEVYTAPDRSQGWGRLDIKNALFPDTPSVVEFTDESTGLSTGSYRDYTYTVIDTGTPLKATLVWTDFPGAVHASNELVNDLDLTVTTPDGTVYPLIGTRDRKNNVEQILIETPELGTYTIRVTGYNIPMGPQDYALVVSGGLPNTYISGTVTSASGAAVQAAQISIVSASGTKRITTNISGKFVTHVSPGTYSVQVSKSGWSFSPRARGVVVSNSPVNDVNFSGTGAAGGLSGTVTSVTGGVVSRTLESMHPYLSSMDQTWTLTLGENITKTRVHFAEIDLMDSGDTIYIMDEHDVVCGTYNGKGEDIWSSWITGNIVKVRLISDDSINLGYGFYIDGYETDLVTQGGAPGAVITLNPGGYSCTSGADGTYNLTGVPPGTYTVSPAIPHWKFQPATKTIDIPAGGSAAGIDFTAFPPGSISGEVKIANTSTTAVNLQSAHPYISNEDSITEIQAPAGTDRMRLHFELIETEAMFDYVYILDGRDNIVEIYTGDNPDFWTPWIEGNVAVIELVTDDGMNFYGFKCDKYEAVILGSGLSNVQVNLSSESRFATTNSAGLFTIPDVDTGDHTVIPYLANWTFDPTNIRTTIAAGMDDNLLFYATVAQIATASDAKTIQNGGQVTLSGMIVTAVFNGFFYVQSPIIPSGICVVSGKTVSEGQTVDVTGIMTTDAGERRINASDVKIH